MSDVVRGMARSSAGVVFEDRGEQEMKGVGEPVRVYAVREGRRLMRGTADPLLHDGGRCAASRTAAIGRWARRSCYLPADSVRARAASGRSRSEDGAIERAGALVHADHVRRAGHRAVGARRRRTVSPRRCVARPGGRDRRAAKLDRVCADRATWIRGRCRRSRYAARHPERVTHLVLWIGIRAHGRCCGSRRTADVDWRSPRRTGSVHADVA